VTADFVAIDFETADCRADSACALGLVRVRDGRVAERESWLIRPPRQRFMFTYIHGITWERAKAAPGFGAVWREAAALLDGAELLVAHNARFDRNVLLRCCAAAEIPAPELRFACTVEVARRAWGVRPTRLPDVCRYLAIRLNHHDAGSDAHACAQIAIAALEDGHAL
jgi:DNA polymerase-3 subunit epsilon